MRHERLYQVITEAKRAGADRLEDFIQRAATMEGKEVSDTVARAMEIIEGIPPLLDLVAEAAEIRGVGLMVRPLLDHAEEYFLNPMDHAPEMAFGITGLLDDAYLALRLVHLVQLTFQPLPAAVAADVEGQLGFLRELLGADLIAELDAETGRAVLKLAMNVAALREVVDPTPPFPTAG